MSAYITDFAITFFLYSLAFPYTFFCIYPFLMFSLRKKDEGMPPRKQPTPPPVYTVPETPEEPASQEGFAQPDEFED